MGTCKLIAIAVGTAVAGLVKYLAERWRNRKQPKPDETDVVD